MRVLIVEDDALLGDGLANGLRTLGFAVDWSRNGDDAEAMLRSAASRLVSCTASPRQRTALVALLYSRAPCCQTGSGRPRARREMARRRAASSWRAIGLIR